MQACPAGNGRGACTCVQQVSNIRLLTVVLYTGEPRRFSDANFQLTGAIASRPLTISNETVDCPYGVCIHEAHIAFEIPEALLRELAARADERPIRLDAQREACAAYILSQRHEGWTLAPDYYDDGGYSGGTMDRPALKLLLSELSAGRVDIIVVY